MHQPLSLSETLLTINASKRKSSTCLSIFNKTKNYLSSAVRIKEKRTIEDLISLLGSQNLTREEIVQCVDLFPSSVEDMKALIPTLSRFDDCDLDNIMMIIKEYDV